MQVDSYQDVIDELKRQGVEIAYVSDLIPCYLGHDGWVGCPVLIDGTTITAWVASRFLGSTYLQRSRASIAEWLTLTVLEAGGEIKPEELIYRFTQASLRHAGYLDRPLWAAHWTWESPTSWTDPGEKRLDLVSMLSVIADSMGFIADARTSITLPSDHPLAGLDTDERKEWLWSSG